MAKDAFHFIVKMALQYEGWEITDDPYRIKYENIKFQIDLSAERIITAIKGTEKIAVEIKTFSGESILQSFYLALGQYLSYQKIIHQTEPERKLYLAIPEEIQKIAENNQFYTEMLSDYRVKIIVFNLEQETITQWID